MWMLTQGSIAKAQEMRTNNTQLQGVCCVCIHVMDTPPFQLLQCSLICIPPTSKQNEIYIISDTTKYSYLLRYTHTHIHTWKLEGRPELNYSIHFNYRGWISDSDTHTVLCGSGGCSPELNVKLYKQVNDLSGNRKTAKTLAFLIGNFYR